MDVGFDEGHPLDSILRRVSSDGVYVWRFGGVGSS